MTSQREAVCIISSCNRRAPAGEPFCSQHRDDDEDGRHEELKKAFVAGACAVLTWTHSGMPQEDLDVAGYDYATSVVKAAR